MTRDRAERLVVAVTGTPGAGKSSFARELAKKLGARLIDLNAIIVRRGLFRLNAEGTRVARMREVRAAFARIVKGSTLHLVVEGHLSHLLQPECLTHVVVLRTKPSVLEGRLRWRGYRARKLLDNLESEALGIVLWEAVHAHGIDKVYEIDTTWLKTRAAVEYFLKALKGKRSLRPGKIDWLEEYFRQGTKIS